LFLSRCFGTTTLGLGLLLAISIAVNVARCDPALAAATRVALVVGNANYKNAPHLPTAGNDAKDIAAVLTSLGYDVIFRQDAGAAELQQALHDFANRSLRADVSLVYYAGYGINVEGEAHLVPVDAEVAAENSVRKETVALRALTAATGGAQALALVILDAMHGNAFQAKLERYPGEPTSNGVAEPANPIRNALVFYAAEPGRTAEEGNGRNSPLAAAILRYLPQPNLEISFFFRNVRDAVRKSTALKQTPYMYGQLSTEKVFLNPKSEAGVRAPDFDPAKVRLCDELAAASDDAKRGPSASDVKLGEIKLAEAVTACTEAVKQFPDMDRFHYQLGRTLLAARNYSSAVASYKRAIELGNVQALHVLGKMYEEGTGVAKDPGGARFYYETAAEKNFAPAIVSLAALYQRGAGVIKDPAKAYDLYRRAADLGNAKAVNEMGMLAEKGLGTAKDAKQARVLYEKAAAAGDEEAMVNLARCYADGIGGRKDIDEARRWLEKPSLAESVEARHMLAGLRKARAK
jgi:tetratricopeptide (TPR) repeat protein